MAEYREEVRDLEFDSSGFKEGPVDARGMSGCSVVVESFTDTAPSTGVWELVGGPRELKHMKSFSTPETGTGVGVKLVRNVGGSATGVQHIGWINAKVTTTETGKRLRFHFYLWE